MASTNSERTPTSVRPNPYPQFTLRRDRHHVQTGPLDDRSAVAWLHRRAGFGLRPGELEAATGRGPAAELARLLDPDSAGIAAAGDPWDGIDLTATDRPRRLALEAIAAWVSALAGGQRPLDDRMTWLLHGWLVSAIDKVTSASMMVEQIRLFRRSWRSWYPDLLRAVTVDAAMLVYLDGRESTGTAPNENYSRELLELFALGVGNYTEADVQAGARALTGWVVRPRRGIVEFVADRHDDTPRPYLGTEVHDVDTVIAAVGGHRAHAAFVARRIAVELLGTAPDDVVDELAATYASSGRALQPVVARALELGLGGASAPLVLGPLPWLVAALRSTGADVTAELIEQLRIAGQVPLVPPNVAGWPRGTAWFGTSTVVARTRMAALVAAAAPAGSAALEAARGAARSPTSPRRSACRRPASTPPATAPWPMRATRSSASPWRC
jgi:uncharacterized protein (DUF1800 family)